VKRVEPCVGVPRLVKVDAVHAFPEHFLDLLCMVTETIVRGICDDHMDGLCTRESPGERACGNFCFDGGRCHFMRRDGSDDTVPVPGRLEVDCHRVGHRERVLA